MHRLLPVALLIATAWLAAAHARASATFAALDAEAEAEIEATGTPGAALAVVSEGALAHSGGYAVTSVEGGGRPTADAVFRLGSTTKMLVAAAVLEALSSSGRRSDQPVSALAPGLDPAIGSLTLHQLLRRPGHRRPAGARA